MSPTSLAVDSTNVYWADNVGPYQGIIWKLPLAGGPATKLTSTANFPYHIAVYGGYVYFQASFSLMRVPTSGISNPVAITTTTALGGVAADASGVYWVDNTSGVYALPTGANTPVTIASGQGAPEYVIVDATTIYWTNSSSGTVMAVAK
jgi:hypothetical protein